MKIKLVAICHLLCAICFSTSAQGTAFSYQGRLNDSGSPATGIYDVRFTIYDAVTNGNLVAGPLTNSATAVTNGLFVVPLDFGSGVFTGAARWLEVDVRTNGGGAFSTLLPLQPIQPVPYAIMANTASNLLGTLPIAQMSGTIPLAQLPGAVLTNNSSGVVLGGTFSGNGSGLTNIASATAGTATNAQSAFNYVYFTPANYSTSAIQAALNTNGAVYLLFGSYTLGHLDMTNGSYLYAVGAVDNFSVQSGDAITSTNQGVVGIKGLHITGNKFANWNSNPTGFSVPMIYPTNYPDNGVWYSNRNGLTVNVGVNASYEDLVIDGFEGKALSLVNPNIIAIANPPPCLLGNITTISNYIGCWTTEPPGTTYMPAEYAPMKWLKSYFNTFGVGAGAGNINIAGNVICENWCNVFFQPEGNSGHGNVTGNTLNHSAWAMIGEQMGLGELIAGNVIAGGGNVWFQDCAGIEMKNNRFASNGSFITFYDDGLYAYPNTNMNFLIENSYDGGWQSANGLLVTNTSPIILTNWGNYSLTIPGNNDGSFFWKSSGGSGSGNVAQTWLAAQQFTNSGNSFAGSGSGLTGIPASAITGGFNTNILVGGHTFYITNGIIMNIQ
jgi:hypothetical protein